MFSRFTPLDMGHAKVDVFDGEFVRVGQHTPFKRLLVLTIRVHFEVRVGLDY